MRRIFPLVLLTSFQFALVAQDTLYFDKNRTQINNPALADLIEILTFKDSLKEVATVREYFPGFIPRAEYQYLSYSEKTLHGRCTSWYKTGKLKIVTDYTRGEMNGERSTYWKNGRLKRKETFLLGNMQSGKCFDSLGVEVPYYDFEVLPSFPNGMKSLNKFVNATLRYPGESIKNLEEGTIKISFVINSQGYVEQIEILQGISKALDEEAVRIIKSFPKWTPGLQDGEPVDVRYTFPFRFQLNMSEKKKEKIRRQKESL